MGNQANVFHLHMISDSTGETLMTVVRAVTAQFENTRPIEHVYPLIRQERQLDRVISEIESAPGIVLYTLVEPKFADQLERACQRIGTPCVNVLRPVHNVFSSFLNVDISPRVGGQHALDDEYFERMEALNYTMLHDDGQIKEDLELADVVLVGVSRTSKTPTCIYLANRGIKAANVPLVPEIKPPRQLMKLRKPLVVGLTASAERIRDIRQNRVLSTISSTDDDSYIDRKLIAQEIIRAKKLCKEQGWPLIDVTRRSIEETAAEIMSLLREHKGHDRHYAP
ncbi:kinase/pyrophosphorylase [Pseudovibrio exalbescens]|uniref:pyruvate, water dikinase regulatory protein n=1 Tax=Pseudovibrio exalbescens TaxID=197461 RepID=UPI002366BCAD|nr:pyruvate, water dikinase regulatory protein [Pseudovibrio exalbescens]MDD7909528.1 kinase/pyrophosphorylase [Pseudovibrio exalbescens]